MIVEEADIIYELNQLKVSKWGICNISSLHPMGIDFATAITMLMNYSVDSVVYEEDAFDNVLTQTREKLNNEVACFTNFLDKVGIKYCVVPDQQEDNNLLAIFPHKTAAVNSGLGWIGKNCLLITQEFGPRVRLGTVLIDMEIYCKNQVIENLCGNCNLCVEACPYKLIKGNQWKVGMDRTDLFNPYDCSRIRESFIGQLGHKHSCGHCLLICPYGR